MVLIFAVFCLKLRLKARTLEVEHDIQHCLRRARVVAQLVREPHILCIRVRRIVELNCWRVVIRVLLVVRARVAEDQAARLAQLAREWRVDVEDLSDLEPAYSQLA